MLIRVVLLAVFMGLPLAAQAQLRAQDGLAALEAGDAVTARAIWQPLAERGDALAQYNLGVLLLTGQGGERDRVQAQHWFKAAAEQGHIAAQLAVADIASEQGDWVLARRWYQRAARGGDARAQMALGQILDNGLGGAQDLEGAVRWYRAAAEKGLAVAQFALGAALSEQGMVDEAADWFEAAAQQGHLQAQHNLAVALADGIGRTQDKAEARHLYLIAAEAGYAPSMHNLALMQARGRGGAQNFRHALAWAITAQAHGHVPAGRLVEALSDVMTPATIGEAEALAARCLSEPGLCD